MSDFHVLVVMWNVYGECENYATLKGHTGAVMELHYNTDGRCVCGTDIVPVAFTLSKVKVPKGCDAIEEPFLQEPFRERFLKEPFFFS